MIRNLIEGIKCRLNPQGHWEWLHEFKTCPSGNRHCQHYRWITDSRKIKRRERPPGLPEREDRSALRTCPRVLNAPWGSLGLGYWY